MFTPLYSFLPMFLSHALLFNADWRKAHDYLCERARCLSFVCGRDQVVSGFFPVHEDTRDVVSRAVREVRDGCQES